MSIQLFIPGPVNVSAKTYQAMATPLFGHRSAQFVELYKIIQPKLQNLFGSEDPVFIVTSSAWGAMEGSLRNVCRERVLNCMCGAFSDKWHDVSLRLGKQATALQVDWGKPIDPEALREMLSSGNFDALTLVHNETSCGIRNPIEEIMAVVRDFPNVISIVDAVSSFAVEPILKDEWGVDIMITASQKALALPPGMALVSVSERALKRSGELKDRGFYFDFLEFLKNHEKGMTPATPCLSLIFGLKAKLEEIEKEEPAKRFERHTELNQMVHQWVDRRGFKIFPEKKYASKGLTCVENNLDIDVAAFTQTLYEKFNYVIDGGYGKLKGKTFRISNMGDENEKSISQLLKNLDIALDSLIPDSP